MLVGYARARGKRENLVIQMNDLRGAGCAKIFTDLACGGRCHRSGLANALGYLCRGDVLVVRRLDRLGQDLDQLLCVAQDLEMKGAHLKVLHEEIDTSMDGRQLLVHLLEALARRECRSMRRT